jgi:hypothetical protein
VRCMGRSLRRALRWFPRYLPSVTIYAWTYTRALSGEMRPMKRDRRCLFSGQHSHRVVPARRHSNSAPKQPPPGLLRRPRQRGDGRHRDRKDKCGGVHGTMTLVAFPFQQTRSTSRSSEYALVVLTMFARQGVDVNLRPSFPAFGSSEKGGVIPCSHWGCQTSLAQ